MWTGFNAMISQDDSPQQCMNYTPNLKEPIKNLSVLYNTLVTTKRSTEECEQKYAIVT